MLVRCAGKPGRLSQAPRVAAALLVLILAAPAVGEEAAPFLRPRSIEDPSGRALSAFFDALSRTERGEAGAITRVAHYGDSLVVVDRMTAVIRQLFQARYGDAGPGFILALPPWSWYRREGVRQGASEGWTIFRSISGGPDDHAYGYGGVTFEARGGRRRSWLETAEVGGRPLKVSRLDLHYYEQPGGGELSVIVDGEAMARLETDAERAGSAFHQLSLDDGPHRLELETVDGRPVRLFGVALERAGPGVVYDALGLNGTCMTVLGRMNTEHLAEQLRHRRPELIVLNFGTGEAKRPGLVARYRETIRPILGDLRAASSKASCLVVAPLDRARRLGGGVIESYPTLPQIVADQRALAAEVGCAFYDTYTAMGGEGSMARWNKAGLASDDLTHPTPRGDELLGRALFDALERAYRSRAAAP